MASFPPKRVSETVTLKFDFADQIRFLEVLSSPTVTVTVGSGVDTTPSAILSGSPSISGTVLSQKVLAGSPGVTYIVTASASSGSNVYKLNKNLSVISDAGGYAPSSLPTLTGTLPNATTGVAYSQALQIAGGYAPYTPVGFIVGAPSWMGFTVVGNQLICAGLPNESDPVSTYNFSPTILDAALNSASAPQVLFRSVSPNATAFKWWLTFSQTTGPDNKIWYATSAVGPYTDIATRSPNQDANFGLTWGGSSNKMGVWRRGVGNVVSVEIITTGLKTSTVPTTIVTLPVGQETQVELPPVISGIVFGIGFTTYSYSLNGGSTWSTAVFPNGRTIRAINRLSSGRWLAFGNSSGDYGDFFFSDQSVPTTWTIATKSDGSGSPEYGIFSYGTGAIQIRNAGGIHRTTNGSAWTFEPGLHGLPSYGSADIWGAYSPNSNVMILSGNQNRSVYRSTDNTNFTRIEFTDIPLGASNTKIIYQNNTFVATFSAGGIKVSTDEGITWQTVVLPTTPVGDVNGPASIAFADFV